jgi:hypothetical protein
MTEPEVVRKLKSTIGPILAELDRLRALIDDDGPGADERRLAAVAEVKRLLDAAKAEAIGLGADVDPSITSTAEVAASIIATDPPTGFDMTRIEAVLRRDATWSGADEPAGTEPGRRGTDE